ncbi:MAG: DUF340 domain-containing protein [Bacillota bacterium]|jgi:hypothetical protein
MTHSGVFRVLAITGAITAIGNWIGFNVPPLEAIPGLAILVAVSAVGYALSKIIPWKLPAIAYISLLAIIISIPGFPGADYVVKQVEKVQFLALCTPILAYAGISIGKDLRSFREQGAKIVVTALLTFVGTFVGSAVIAQIILALTGAI